MKSKLASVHLFIWTKIQRCVNNTEGPHFQLMFHVIVPNSKNLVILKILCTNMTFHSNLSVKRNLDIYHFVALNLKMKKNGTRKHQKKSCDTRNGLASYQYISIRSHVVVLFCDFRPISQAIFNKIPCFGSFLCYRFSCARRTS